MNVQIYNPLHAKFQQLGATYLLVDIIVLLLEGSDCLSSLVNIELLQLSNNFFILNTSIALQLSVLFTTVQNLIIMLIQLEQCINYLNTKMFVLE